MSSSSFDFIESDIQAPGYLILLVNVLGLVKVRFPLPPTVFFSPGMR